MNKIHTLSTIALIVLVPYILAYPYFALDFQMRMVVLEPGLWESHRWVEPGSQIATVTKLIYLGVWLVPTGLGLAALLAAIRIANFFRNGVVFDDKVAVSILHLGQFVACSSVTSIFAGSVSPMIVSWHNASGALDLRLWISVPNMSLVLCGLAFVLMGSVLRVAIALAKENEAFV